MTAAGKKIDIAADANTRPRTGILPSQDIHEMVGNGEIRAASPLDADQIQPASIDLRLGDFAYPADTSFLPGAGSSFFDKIKQLDERFDDFKIALRPGAVLEKNRVYI